MDDDDSMDVDAPEAEETNRGIRRWLKEWPDLELDKKCSASSDHCWLCDRLQEWNIALRNFLICLTETSPGKICLAAGGRVSAIDFKQPNFSEDTAPMTVWLLRMHRCIETLEMGEEDPSGFMRRILNPVVSLGHVVVPDPVAELTCNLRHISIGFHAGDKLDSLLGAIGPIKELEHLSMQGVYANPTLAKRLAELLTANADSLRKVHVEGFTADGTDTTLCCDALMEGIACCRNLTELLYCEELGTNGLQSLAGFLRSNKTLKKFWLEHEKEVQVAFCHFMSENTTLIELYFTIHGDVEVVKDVLRAVENHKKLERLSLLGGLWGSNQQQLKSLIRNNRSLRSLTIVDCHIDFGKLIAEGLSENKTLECLDLSECKLDFQSVSDLCDAVAKSTRLVKVKFPPTEASPSLSRETLATELREKNLYGRVQLEWTDCDAAGLAAFLRVRPIDLELDTAKLTPGNLASLCEALSSSLLVRSLTVRLSEGNSEYVGPLSDALEKNESLKSVKLIENDKSCGFAAKVADGLRYNTTVTYLAIKCPKMNSDGAKLLSGVIAESRSLNDVDLSVQYEPVSPECIDILSRGVVQNPFMRSFIINSVDSRADQTVYQAALMGNSVCLNRAVRFVLGRNTETPCAEAFKLLQAQPSLIGRVKLASGMSEKEAKGAVMSAAGKVDSCGVNHDKKFISCAKGVVYKIPLTCGSVYIGETEGCVNQRLRQHEKSRERGDSSAWSNHTEHCTGRGCEPKFKNTEILAKHNDKLTRQIIEAYHIKKNHGTCISQPSVSLSKIPDRRRDTQSQ